MTDSLKKRAPKELIALTSIALAAFATAIVWSASGGVRHKGNFGALEVLAMWLGSYLVAAAGLATLIWVYLSFRAASSAWRWSGLGMGVVALLMPFLFLPAMSAIRDAVECRDFEKAGPGQLRQAVADLIRSAASKNYQLRYFGGEVPAHEIPPVIHQFIPNTSYVTVDEQGVVLVTDGMGGWRGGYMITPPGSNLVPQKSRPIADGFFYVTTQ